MRNPKHLFKLLGKKIITILSSKILLNPAYDWLVYFIFLQDNSRQFVMNQDVGNSF